MGINQSRGRGSTACLYLAPELHEHLKAQAETSGMTFSAWAGQTLALVTGFDGAPSTANQAVYAAVRRLAFDYARRIIEAGFNTMPEDFDQAVAMGLIDPAEVTMINELDQLSNPDPNQR